MRIKEGTVLRPFGPSSSLQGEISDEMAKYLIESGKAKESDFETTVVKKASRNLSKKIKQLRKKANQRK